MNQDAYFQLPVSRDPIAAATSVGLPSRFDQAAQMHTMIHRCGVLFRRRWWVVVLAFLLVGGPAVLYAWHKPPTFESKATMWMTGMLNLPEHKLLSEESATYLDTQAELIKSSVVQFRAYSNVCARFPGAGFSTNGTPEKLPFTLAVRSSTKGSVLDLSATGGSAAATRAFLDAVMDEYLALKKDSRKQSSSGALLTITDQINSIEKQIQQRQTQIRLFQESNNISYLTEHGLSAGSHLSKLAEVLSDLRTERSLVELMTPAQFKDLSEGAAIDLPGVALPGGTAARELATKTATLQSAYFQAVQQFQILKAKRDEFAEVLRPTHSKMVKLSREIAGLDQLLKTLEDVGERRAAAYVSNRKQSLDLQIENLEHQYRAWETNAAEASQRLAEYDRMKQEMQRSQALYDRMLGLLQTVDLNNNLDQEPLTPLAPASVARPTLAKYKVAAAGLSLAVILAGGCLLLLGITDDRFASVEELKFQLSEDTIGQIPENRGNWANSRIQLRKYPEDWHAFSESFRNLRSFMLFMFKEEVKPSVILITSAAPKEGKSTVASNLARTLAMSGSRVLLVDADLRRGALYQVFGLSPSPGLQEVLRQEVSLAQAIVPTAQPELFLLPAGETETASSDIFLRGRMDLLLRDLAAQYDYVVIDSAPVLATDDAACLGPNTDGVFMVVRASYTSSRMAQEALDRLRKRAVKVLGVVYNRVPAASDYYYQYRRDYSQPKRTKRFSGQWPSGGSPQAKAPSDPGLEMTPGPGERLQSS